MKEIFSMKLMNYILEKEPFITYLALFRKIGLDHEDARNLVNNTSGIYAFMRKHLFNRVSNFKPQWVENRSKAVIAALLCGSWTECEGDKEIISKLAEKESTTMLFKNLILIQQLKNHLLLKLITMDQYVI